MVAQTLQFDFLLPPPPASHGGDELKIYKKMSDFKHARVESAGPAFVASVRRHRLKRGLEEDTQLQEALDEAAQENAEEDEDEEESPLLLQSDPNNWKEQDHYAVLGLSKKRWQATEDDIRRAYRRKVLKHHPDKKAGANGEYGSDDAFFKCIQKAWEILSDDTKRRQWDSVDPNFDDDTLPNPKSKTDFFELYTPAFVLASRFSLVKPVPSLGSLDSSREDVEEFYSFWYNFQSWRTFEALDEEDVDSADSREEKRWLDRKNKSARAKRKKEENARIIRLTDQSFKADPRIQMFKEQEKMAKGAKKREKEAAALAAAEEAKKKAEEEERDKARVAQEEKDKREQDKKDKEMAKRLVKKEKKNIKALLKPALEADEYLGEKLDVLFEKLDIKGLEVFRDSLESVKESGIETLVCTLESKCAEMNGQVYTAEEERALREKMAAAVVTRAAAVAAQLEREAREEAKKPLPWSAREVAVLIKAVKMIPGGSLERWSKIADFVNHHSGEDGETEETRKQRRQRSPDECIKMSKDVQQRGASAAERSKLQDTVVSKKKEVEIKETPSMKDPEDIVAEIDASPRSSIVDATAVVTWSAEDQVALENALRKYPASAFTSSPSDRWEKIASELGRPTRAVKLRMKELQEMIKNKKKSNIDG